MVNIRLLKGHWQNACAQDVMTRSWELVRKHHCSLSTGLKRSWKEIKDFIRSINNSYAEYKYKLRIERKTIILTFKSDNLDEIVDKSFEKIAEIKGKQFIYNISERFYNRYDFLLDKLKTKGTLTFTENVFITKLK